MATVSRSKILSKIKKRSKGAWKRSRSKEARAKGQQLPGGIIKGVAQFSSSKLGENDKGIPFVSLTGIVKEPEEYAGARATIFHRFAETEHKSIEDVLDDLSSNLQLLGCDTEGTTEDDFERLLKELGKSKPHFYFNTSAWKFGDRSGVSVFIQGLADDWDDESEEADGDAEDDESEEDASDEDDSEADDEDDSESEDDEDAESEEADDVEEDWEPAKSDVYLYKAPRTAKARECEVTSVNKSKQTVSLKRCDDDKPFKNVPWDKLEGGD